MSAYRRHMDGWCLSCLCYKRVAGDRRVRTAERRHFVIRNAQKLNWKIRPWLISCFSFHSTIVISDRLKPVAHCRLVSALGLLAYFFIKPANANNVTAVPKTVSGCFSVLIQFYFRMCDGLKWTYEDFFFTQRLPTNGRNFLQILVHAASVMPASGDTRSRNLYHKLNLYKINRSTHVQVCCRPARRVSGIGYKFVERVSPCINPFTQTGRILERHGQLR